MIQKGIVITSIFAFNTLIQLINQVVITRLFGASLTLDIFLAAVALPTVLVTVIYGTVNDSFLPLYTHAKIKNPKGAQDFFFTHLIKILFVTIFLTALLSLCAPIISQMLYGARGKEFVDQVAFQMRILFLSVPFAYIATILGAYLYSHKYFYRFPLAQAIGNGANLLLTIALVGSLGIWSMVFAFVANIVLQIFILQPTFVKGTFKSNISISPFFLAWIPLVVSMFAARSDTLLIRSLASNLPEGYLVYLNLTSRIFSIAAGVSTIGIQILLLPHLVEHIAQKNFVRADRMVNKAKIIGITVTSITSFALWLIGPFAIHLLFVGGKFTAADAQTATVLLPIFLFPAIGWGVQSIFFQPLMAIRKYFHLAVINLIALGLGWGSAIMIQKSHGSFQALTFGLIILVFSGIIGSEIVWQFYKSRMLARS